MLQMRGEPPEGPTGRDRAPQAGPQGPQPPSEAQRSAASPHPHPKLDPMEVEDHQEEAASELATARSLHEWARKLPQPARDKEVPAARKRLELAEGEDKKRKPPAERFQSVLSRVDHRQRQAQAARDALAEAEQAIEAFKAECTRQEALLANDQEELQVAQSLHQAWGPSAREGEQASQLGKQPRDTEAAAEKTERQRDLFNRLYEALPAGQNRTSSRSWRAPWASPPHSSPPRSSKWLCPPRRERAWRHRVPRKIPSRSGSSRRAPTPAPEEGAAERTADHRTEAAEAEQL